MLVTCMAGDATTKPESDEIESTWVCSVAEEEFIVSFGDFEADENTFFHQDEVVLIESEVLAPDGLETAAGSTCV